MHTWHVTCGSSAVAPARLLTGWRRARQQPGGGVFARSPAHVPTPHCPTAASADTGQCMHFDDDDACHTWYSVSRLASQAARGASMCCMHKASPMTTERDVWMAKSTASSCHVLSPAKCFRTAASPSPT